MDGYRAFRPEHMCYALAASNATPGGATFISAMGGGDQTLLMDGATLTGRAFLGFGMTSDAAVANAAVPVPGGNFTAALPLAAGTVQTFTFTGQGFFVAARTAGGAGTIYLALGDGV